MIPPSSLWRSLVCILVTPLLLTHCGKKAQLEVETKQYENAANEQKAQIAMIQAESNSIGNLGHYNLPQQMHLDHLRNRIKTLGQETQSLEEEKATALKDVEILQKELDEYRARHLR
jgi:predicted nuclease with TOPRIM domain